MARIAKFSALVLLAAPACEAVSLQAPSLRAKHDTQDTRTPSAGNATAKAVKKSKQLAQTRSYIWRINGSTVEQGTRGNATQESRALRLTPPSTLPYNLGQPWKEDQSQWGQIPALWEPLLERIDSQRKSGYQPFFVESGARDGEEHSNSLFLEKNAHWAGLLVEPSNVEYPNLLSKHRKAWSFHGCLSPTSGPVTLRFSDTADGLSKVVDVLPPGTPPQLAFGAITSQAETLVAMLHAVQPPVKTIDFWSLDIEGAEADVLENTNFSEVEIGVVMIEMNKGEDLNRRIRNALSKNGFSEVTGTLYNEGVEAVLDGVFVNPKYYQKRGWEVPQPFGNVRGAGMPPPYVNSY